MVNAARRVRLSRAGSHQNAAAERRLSRAAQYGVALGLVGAAGFLAFVASSVVPAPALTLIFVLPVVISGTSFGLGPSVAATLASVLAFDYFFTQPYFTLRMNDPSEIWAAALLLITAGIVSTVAWQSRQHALHARRSAQQADELRLLAHRLIEGAPQSEIVLAAATSLSRMFEAPAAIYSKTEGALRVEAAVGHAKLGAAETQAAESALEAGLPMRGQTYPNERSKFDMWPVGTPGQCHYVIALDLTRAARDRPADVDRLVEIVAGYLMADLGRERR